MNRKRPPAGTDESEHPTLEWRGPGSYPAAADIPDEEGEALTLTQDVSSLDTVPYSDSGSGTAPPPSVRPDAKLPKPGDIVNETLRMVEELGRGAMGVVFAAEDLQLERKVAVKFVRPELLGRGFRDRFLNEARAMARVTHANVVRIYAFGTHEGIPYFVMEMIEGYTLEDWLEAQTGPVDLDLALGILSDVCSGVSAIHAAGTVHRDIKPSNILIDADMRSRITDFGVATLGGEGLPGRNEIVGTPAYMAPEVSLGTQTAENAPISDVYSLGCVAFELFTGRRPFEIEGPLALIALHAGAPVPIPSTIRSDLPTTLDQALLHALAKQPEERTVTVEQFRRALIQAREGSLEPVRILIADDNEDLRDMVEIKLRDEFPGAEIVGVGDGLAALAAIESALPSVAILDLQMPHLDGAALSTAIRDRPEWAGMPIIVLTASGGPRDWEHLASVGVDRFMIKPVSLGDLVMAIRNAIRERVSVPS